MTTFRSALVLGAAIACMLPGVATAGDVPASPKPGSVLLAQYDGPGFPGQGYGGPYGAPGYGGPGYGDIERGYGPGPMGGPYGPPRATRHAAAQRLSYHGFRIEIGGGGNPASDVAAVEHQIDMMDDVGLPLSDLRLFRSLPIRVEPGARSHYAGGPEVVLNEISPPDNRPILLHEYMHVFNHRGMPGGFHNPDIHRFFEEARSQGLYPEGAYMLKNASEFFAVTASCYLYGTVARDPYSRETIRERQPAYYAFLEHLFGPPRGSHLSSDGSDVIGHPDPLSEPVARHPS